MLKKKFKLNKGSKQGLQVKVEGSRYRDCVKNAANRWSNTKKGQYGKGLLNSKADPRKTERIGLIGESALAQVLGLEVDFSYIEGGDQRDFEFKGYSLDLKTASRLYDWEAGLIYAESAQGRKIKLKSEIYVFGYLQEENKEEEYAIVNVLGWISRVKILNNYGLMPAKVGFHKNYEIPYKDLTSILKLLKIKEK